MGNHSKRLRETLHRMRRLMWMKRSIPLGLLVFWTVVMLFLIWHQGTPEDWTTETVRFVRMSEVTTRSMSRWGTSYHHYDVLVTEDDREFRFQEGEEVQLPLSASEECRLVYEDKGDHVAHIRALSTAEDGVLVALEDSIDAHWKMVSFLWWMLAAGAVLCLLALALVEAFGMKNDRMWLAKVKGELAKAEGQKQT